MLQSELLIASDIRIMNNHLEFIRLLNCWSNLEVN